MENQTGNAIVDTQELVVSPEASGSEYGQISINNDVVAIIAHETAKKVPGVVELKGTASDGLAGIIGRKDKAIRIEKENEELLTIDLTVVLAYGVNIPEICVQLQAAVKEAVERMTGQKVFAVNIVVQGIRNLEEKKAIEG